MDKSLNHTSSSPAEEVRRGASFLSVVAADMLAHFSCDMRDVTVVFPGKRAGMFLNREFAALSDSIDDEDEATEWLERFHYDFLSLFAAACRQDETALLWFRERDLKLYLLLIDTIQRILLQQSLDASNVHKLRRI